MPTTHRIGPGRRRWQALAVALVLATVPACTSLEDKGSSLGNLSAAFDSNPYEPSTFNKWWNGDKTKGDVSLPGKENPARTAMDEKARQDLEEAKNLYLAKEYAKAEP